MTLKEYLFRYEITSTEFSKKLGVSRSYFCQVLNGKKRMHPDKALLIELLTDAEVTRDEALFPEFYAWGNKNPRRMPREQQQQRSC